MKKFYGEYEYKVCCAGVLIGTLKLEIQLPDYLVEEILNNAIVDNMEVIENDLPKAKRYEEESHFGYEEIF